MSKYRPPIQRARPSQFSVIRMAAEVARYREQKVYCRGCGEWIPHPTTTNIDLPEGGKVMTWRKCTTCMGEHGTIPPRRFPAECADIQYHGDMWEHGEW